MASRLQAEPGSARTIRDEQEDYDRENRVIYAELNRLAVRATELNAQVSKVAVELLEAKINDRVAHEKKGWPDSIPFAESTYVVTLRRLLHHFAKAASITTTTADIAGSPRNVLSWFFDL
jgi:hypothetical protein